MPHSLETCVVCHADSCFTGLGLFSHCASPHLPSMSSNDAWCISEVNHPMYLQLQAQNHGLFSFHWGYIEPLMDIRHTDMLTRILFYNNLLSIITNATILALSQSDTTILVGYNSFSNMLLIYMFHETRPRI